MTVVNHYSLAKVLREQQVYFTSKEKTFSIRLAKFSVKNYRGWDLVEYAKYLKSLNLVNSVAEFKFVLKVLGLAGVSISFFEKRHLLEIVKVSNRDASPEKDLISNGGLRTLLDKLDNREFLAVFLLAASGRRSVDITRISSENSTN